MYSFPDPTSHIGMCAHSSFDWRLMFAMVKCMPLDWNLYHNSSHDMIHVVFVELSIFEI